MYAIRSYYVQSSAAMYNANWVTFVVICVMVFFLQIGAEVIGLIGKTKRPLLNFLARLRMKVGEERGSK